MNIIEESRSILEAAGYRTVLGTSSADVCFFEDASILGAIFVHPSITSLLERWQDSQDSFLGTHSRSLHNDPVKAWNIYTIHLTSDTGSGSQATQVFNIEQDFRGTRKVVRIGVINRADVKEALLPILGLQHHLALSSKNLTERLRERLALSSNVLVRLLEPGDETTIVADLMEEP